MDSTLVNAITNSGQDFNATTVLLIVFCTGWLVERIIKVMYNRNNQKKIQNGEGRVVPEWKEINSKLDKKVNGVACTEFKTRIGKESEEHRRNISEIKTGIGKIQADVAYLRGRAD